MLQFEWDEGKRQANLKKHGIDFAVAIEKFDWSLADIFLDERWDYGEQRFGALGFIGNRLHKVVFTQRGSLIRIINLRKANARERKKYVQKA
jgi:uncharacterized DUF497 family protein